MSEQPLFRLTRGTSRLVVNVPHAGTCLPAAIARQLTPVGQAMVDTDWHVDRLVDFATALDVTLMVATHARTVVDLNRSPDGALLYPGQIETGLCPTETFAGEALYARAPPASDEIEERTAQYWRPYHDVLQAELARVKALHGTVHLLDMHSIPTFVPRLFEGRLPDLNIGTNDGAAADPKLVARVLAAMRAHTNFTQVLDGRFKGGAITRGYGRPAAGVHAIQIEIAQSAYMNEADPHAYDPARAAPLVHVLRDVIGVLSASK